MGAEIVVFLGPTLSALEARARLDAQYLPPVGQGDVVRAVHTFAPKAIAIVDGVFAQRPAVRHKELLWAMSCGVRLYGAASMGAIRAAELSDFGMKGHGLIYRWYRRTQLADDADVAVAMAPPEFGSAAFSEALVDIRIVLKRAERAGLVCRGTRLVLEEIARSLHFSQRQLDGIIRQAKLDRDPEMQAELNNLSAFLNSCKSRQKKEDTVSLLDYLQSGKHRADFVVPSDFTLTDAWLYDLEMSGIQTIPGMAKNIEG